MSIDAVVHSANAVALPACIDLQAIELGKTFEGM